MRPVCSGVTKLTHRNRDQQGAVKTQLDKLEDNMSNLSTETASRISTLKGDLLKDIRKLIEEKNAAQLAAETVASEPAADNIVSPAPYFAMNSGLTNLRSALESLTSEMVSATRANTILSSLFFDSMYLREETIVNAEEGTFEWLLPPAKDYPDLSPLSSEGDSTSASEASIGETSTSSGSGVHDGDTDIRTDSAEDSQIQAQEGARRHARKEFTKWLASGQGLFHISGKAGSGKSTLMKFLSAHGGDNEAPQDLGGRQETRLCTLLLLEIK